MNNTEIISAAQTTLWQELRPYLGDCIVEQAIAGTVCGLCKNGCLAINDPDDTIVDLCCAECGTYPSVSDCKPKGFQAGKTDKKKGEGQ